MAKISRPVRQGPDYQGMNWIRPEKRLAIYLRDGLACVYCGGSVEECARFTLDHLVCYVDGGMNGAENLVTACVRCNSARGSRGWRPFVKDVAQYLNHGVKAATIVKHITTTIKRELPMDEARMIFTRRGSFSKALMAAAKGGQR